MTIYLANDKYSATLTSGYTVGQTTLSVSSVPDNVPTIVTVAKGTDKETVFTVTGKTVNSLTGVARIRGANVNLDATTPVTVLNNQEFINQYENTAQSAEAVSQLLYAADGGSTDAYVVSLDPAPTAYTEGITIVFKANTANTGAATLNVNSLGAKTIKKLHDEDLVTGDIESGQVVIVVYDGTNFQLQTTTPALLDNSVTTAKIADSNVTTAKIADSNVTTVKIADANVTNRKMKLDEVQVATSGSSITTSSTSLVDLTGATVTFTPTVASNALVLFSGVFSVDTNNQAVNAQLVVDGSVQSIPTAAYFAHNFTGSVGDAVSFQRWITGLGASSHTIKVQWKVSGGTGTNYWFSLIVIPYAS